MKNRKGKPRTAEKRRIALQNPLFGPYRTININMNKKVNNINKHRNICKPSHFSGWELELGQFLPI